MPAVGKGHRSEATRLPLWIDASSFFKNCTKYQNSNPKNVVFLSCRVFAGNRKSSQYGYFYNPFCVPWRRKQSRKILLLHASDFNFTSKMEKRLILFCDWIQTVPIRISHSHEIDLCLEFQKSNWKWHKKCSSNEIEIDGWKRPTRKGLPTSRSVLKDSKISISYRSRERIERKKEGTPQTKIRFDRSAGSSIGNPIRWSYHQKRERERN